MPARLAPDQSRGYLIPIGTQARPDGYTEIFRRMLAMFSQRPQIVVISAQTAGDAAADDIEPRLREWLAKDYVACVFEAGGTGFGYSIFRDLPDCVHLRHFFVEAAFRRRGLGRRAFERLREMFPRGKRILVEVLVWNAPAAAFWKSVGFEERYLGLQMSGE